MKLGRRILTAVLTAALLVTAACSQDTTWVAEYEETKLPAGVYNLYLLNNYELAYSKVEDATADILSQQIDGVSAEQWMKDSAMEDLKRYFAIEKKFEEYGISLSEEEKTSIKEYASTQMESNNDFFTKNGISLNSLELYFTNNFKGNTLFMKLYGEGGELEIPAEELRSFFVENYTNSQHIVVPKFDQATGTPLEGDALEAAKKEAQSYYDRAVKGEESFGDILLSWELTQYAEGEAPADHTHEDWEHDNILRKTDTSFPAKYLELVGNATIGTPVTGEDDNYFYVILRKDVLGREETLATYTQQLMVDMKTEEYKEKVNQWGQEIELKLNQASLNLYTPKKLSLQ